MKNIFSKFNTPYIVGVTVAAIALVASGVFALAPYVAFLAPVAALGVGLPFIISGAVLSVVAGVLSAVAISKNSTISQSANIAPIEPTNQGKNPNETKAITLGKQGDPSLKGTSEAPIQRNQIAKEEDGQGWFNIGNKVRKLVTGIDKQLVGLLARNLSLVDRGFDIAGNSTAVGSPVSNDIGNPTSHRSSLVTCPNPTYQQIMQSKVNEASTRLADAEKWYQDNYGTPKEGNTNNKDGSQSIIGKVFSVPRNLWNSVQGLFSSSSEPQWYQDLRKSKDLEEITDVSPRVDNDPSKSCRVTRSVGKHMKRNETLTPCSIDEYSVETNLEDLHLCCALPTKVGKTAHFA